MADTNDNDPDMEMILADMAREFLEGCEDRIEEIDAALNALRDKHGNPGNNILEIKRHIHSLKGMGGTFGFSSISLISHALEDYFETLYDDGPDGYYDVQLFVDRIRQISEEGEEKDEEWVAQTLRELPLKAQRKSIRENDQKISILMLLPIGIQRKIVSQELSRFGFNVIIADTTLDAINKGIKLRPNIIMSSMILDDMTGTELAGIFKAIHRTAHNPFLLITSDDIKDDTREILPDNVTILRKGTNFSSDLMSFFGSRGYIG